MHKKFQHEIIGLTDDEAVDVIVEIAKLSLECPDLWNVMKRCPFEGKKRDFFMHFCSYLIGLTTARNLMCGMKCYKCDYEKSCPLHAEIKFVGDVIHCLKTRGEEEARKFVKARINSIRRAAFESSREVA